MQLQPGGCHLMEHRARPQGPAVPKGPSWPFMPPSHHQPLTSYGKLDSDILGMSLWPNLNCNGWELQTSVLSAKEPSLPAQGKTGKPLAFGTLPPYQTLLKACSTHSISPASDPSHSSFPRVGMEGETHVEKCIQTHPFAASQQLGEQDPLLK